MAESHTHGPGEDHSHSHSHSHGPPQSPMMPPPDPTLQALIDEDFREVGLKLSGDSNNALCARHALPKCDECGVDFTQLNRLSNLLVANPNLLCPPPANIVTQKISQIVTSTKDEGNTLFKSSQHLHAIVRYTTAANVAISRPPWEANQLMRDELSTVISNRSAAFYEAQDYISALADAETVIAVRRPWPKGHFRKAKALVGLDKLHEAADAVRLGLSFEPTNNELINFLAEIEKLEQKARDAKSQSTVENEKASSMPVAA